MEKLFGTDGIRGVAGEFPLTQDFVTRIGSAIAQALQPPYVPPTRGELKGGPLAIIGRDTRASGEWIERALTVGLSAPGFDVLSLGVLPTPGVAYLTRLLGARCGISISASHNPYEDNGIKVFGADGFKIPDAVENEIETRVQSEKFSVETAPREAPRATPTPRGTVLARSARTSVQRTHASPRSAAERESGASERAGAPSQSAGVAARTASASAYEKFLLDSSPNPILRDSSDPALFAGKRVAVDCNHGATYEIAPRVLRELGAEVMALNVEPDGTNINRGYDALEPKLLRETVLRERADWGVQFDGDGDRAVFVDELGNYLDGDFVLAILARDWVERGVMNNRTVVSTVMANVGLEHALSEMGVTMERVAVGDRWVTERMRENGSQIGGEQSGHIVLFDRGHTTGDGIYTAIRVADVMARKKVRLSELAAGMKKYPQVLVNVRVPRKPPLENFPQIQFQVARSREMLGEGARIHVRYSGTENLARVMIEGLDAARIAQEAHAIARVIQETIH